MAPVGIRPGPFHSVGEGQIQKVRGPFHLISEMCAASGIQQESPSDAHCRVVNSAGLGGTLNC